MNWMDDINNSWTLFLDRDGVINHESEDDYIRDWKSFHFLPGVIESFNIFSTVFKRIFIVTNQKGVGKGLMTESDLAEINKGLLSAVETAGGHIDKIYYCTALDDNDPCRKPNNGMALQAKKEYPEIDFSKSLMVGNTVGDMQFGKSSGMHTVFIPSAKPVPPLPHPLVDEVFKDLYTLAKALQKSVAAK
jgi:D-glycero-D-manno-heptose 1,7-bisphosphate phosphatase